VSSLSKNPKKSLTVKNALARLNAEDKDLKYLAQRAICSYIRSVFLNKDKTVFKVNEIPIDQLS
jgi:ATP-dependent RNA helicase DDX10/DBP4